ncbi:MULTISPECIES: ankyrin repeat domain-containing protein [Candidatus Cardinium]|uniref:ankyrin repeat domain-containing protein n=1 Tax=Candidatus Cardinium TaxID=273135 RepID=UPI001FAA377E|nr:MULTISPECIES: ankyrin repeat domain-containing protein [Cardinium]
MQYLTLSILIFCSLQARSCGCTQVAPEETDLIAAVQKGNIESVRACLAEGADPNKPDEYGTPVLYLAAAYDTTGHIVKLLLDKGAAIDTKDKDGWTPLDWADYKKNESAMKHLINKAIDLNYTKIRCQNGKNLLHCAAALSGEESKEIVRRLLVVLDPNVQDSSGCIPLDYVVANRKDLLVQLLLHSQN